MPGNDKNTGNVGNSKPIAKREIDPIKQLLGGLDEVETKRSAIHKKAWDSVEDLSKLATTRLLEISEQLNNMGKTIDGTVKDAKSGITGIASGGSSVFKQFEKEIDSLESDMDSFLDKEKKRNEELAGALTKSGRARLNQKFALEDELSGLRESLQKKLQSDEFTDEDKAKFKEEYKESYKKISQSIKDIEEQKIPIAERATQKIVGMAETAIKQVAKYLTDNISKGISDAVNWNIQNYTELAGKTGSAEDTIQSIKDLTSAYKKSGYGSAVNINNELKPMFLELAKQGLQGENLRETAITNVVDKKIMPWFDNTSQNWITLTKNISDTSANVIRGQQLYLRETEAGNRLLQTGIITQLTQQMTPLLQSIKDDVFVQAHSDEIYQLAQGLVDAGLSPEQAQQYASKYIEMQKNPYQAVTSGDVSTTLMALNYAKGMTASENIATLLDIQSRGQSGNIFASSAYANVFGSGILPATREGNRYAGEIAQYLRSIDRQVVDYESILKNTRDNTKNYVSKANRFENTIHNFTTGIGDMFSGAYSGKMLSTAVTTLISSIPGLIAFKKVAGKLAGMLSKSGGNLGAGGVEEVLANTAGTGVNIPQGAGTGVAGGAGNLLTKGLISTSKGSVLSAGGVLGGITAVALTASDVSEGKKYGDKGMQLVGDAVFGSEKSGMNTVKQMGKYAGAGALIGSLIPGVGTVVGGVVGGAVGLIASQFAKEREATQTAIEQAGASGTEDTQTVVTLLATINDNLTSGKVKVIAYNTGNNLLENTFGNTQNPRDTFEQVNRKSKYSDDNAYRTELIDRISTVGAEIVEAIKGTSKPDNIKKNYSLGLEMSQDIDKIVNLGSFTGVSTTND